MTGSAMRKPRIHPGRGSASADSMIDGRTMVIGTSSRELGHQGPLAERLGVGVGVGPAEGLGPGLPDLDQLLLDPVLAQPLGPLGQQVECRPRPARARASLRERGQPRRAGGTAASVSPALAAGGLDLGPPVDVDGEGVAVEQLLAAPRPGGCRPRRRSRPG